MPKQILRSLGVVSFACAYVTLAYAEDLQLKASESTASYSCDGKDISVLGSKNNFTFSGKCGQLNLIGSDNRLTFVELTQVSVLGSDNEVHWTSGSPQVSTKGKRNNIGAVAASNPSK